MCVFSVICLQLYLTKYASTHELVTEAVISQLRPKSCTFVLTELGMEVMMFYDRLGADAYVKLATLGVQHIRILQLAHNQSEAWEIWPVMLTTPGALHAWDTAMLPRYPR